MSFFKELQRRKVIRVAIAYAIVAWLLLQVSDTLVPALRLPEWFNSGVALLLILGFPVALLFAWAFDLTPDGIRRTRSDDAADQSASSNTLDYVLIGGLVFVAAVTIWGQLQSSSDSNPRQASAAGQTQSIAVLPFLDMSPDGDQEYFGDGIAAELLDELTRLDGLRVAGRTSSFSFKDSAADLQTIGKTLDVDWILEGSIRKDGDRILITAQLVSAADGYQTWSQTYDRQLANIFETQNEIATSVAGALGVRLKVGGVNAFRGAGTQNVEAYEAYLQGMLQPIAQAARSFERATQLDPNYAAAWARLGVSTVSTMWITLPEDAPAIIARAYPFVVRAVELDPASAEATTLLATLLYPRRDWIGAEKGYAKAFSLLSDRPNANHRANMLMRAGRSAMARKLYDMAESLEHWGGKPADLRWYVSVAQKQFAEAREITEWGSGTSGPWQNLEITLNQGDAEAIKAAIRELPTTYALFSSVLNEFDSPGNVLSILRAVYADKSSQWPSKLHQIALLAAYFGDAEFALQLKAEEVRNTPVRLGAIWYPVMSDVRHLPGFKKLVTDLNLVAYWRAYGWADLCRPLGDDDFTCD